MIWAQAGGRVGQVRKDLKLTRTQFGKLIGVSGQYVGRVERGICGLSVDSIVQLCHAADVSADYILFGAVDPAGDPSAVAALCGLSREQVIIALDIIKKVAKFVNTEGGNEVLIQEVAKQQLSSKE